MAAGGQGLGVNSVPTEAATYYDIAIEDQRRELEAARTGRFGVEAKLPLINGEVPVLPSNSPWSVGDGFGVDEAVSVNHPDPSGVNRNRGIL